MILENEEEDYSIKLLSSTIVFSGLAKNHLKNILPYCQKLQFPANTFILEEGSVPDGMYIVMQGRIEVLKKQANTQNYYPLSEMGIGQCFGEIAVIDQSPRSASIRTIEPTTVLKISINNIDRIAEIDMLVYTTMLKNLAMDLSRRLRYVNELLVLRSKN